MFSSGKVLRAGLLLLMLGVLLGTTSDDRFQSLGHKLMCACGCNQVLLECNHVGCTYSSRMRDELAASVDRGDSDDLSLQSFVQKYGPTVLLAPTTTGFNRVAWIVPYAMLGIGLFTAVLVVRGWRGGGPPGGASGGPSIGNGGGGTGGAGSDDLEKFREQARRETDL
jgi:cytochrome c-type biogenesis protein CcmH/NrfF